MLTANACNDCSTPLIVLVTQNNYYSVLVTSHCLLTADKPSEVSS